MATFKEYLSSLKSDDKQTITHTRIPDRSLGIYGGKYAITDLSNFYLKYSTHIHTGKFEYLTEKQINEPNILIDLDFHFKPEIETRQYTALTIKKIIECYVKQINDLFTISTPYKVYVMEKDDVNTSHNDKTKDGIHMIFTIRASHQSQMILREKVISEMTSILKSLKLTNTINDVLDISITRGSTNWQLYGSRKPGHDVYKLSYLFEINNTSIALQEHEHLSIYDILIATSCRLKHNPLIKLKQSLNIPQPRPQPVINYNNTNLKAFVDIISLEYIDNYSDWIKLIWACKSINDFELAHYISKRGNKYSGDETETRSIWNNSTDNTLLTVGTIYYYAKISNQSKYIELTQSNLEEFLKYDIEHYDLAKLINQYYGDNYIYYDRHFYVFNGIYWVNDENDCYTRKTIVEHVCKLFKSQIKKYNHLLLKDERNQDYYTKIINRCQNIVKSIKNNSYQKHIIEQLQLFTEKHTDFHKWEKNPYAVVFTNGVYYLDEGKFDKGRREDYMTLTTGYDYIEPTSDQIKVVEDLINTIFPFENEKILYMISLATALYGSTLEKFIIANGQGGNGKGVINELMTEMMGNYVYECANAVLLNPISDKNNPSVANMNNKRIIIYREPDTSCVSKLNIATVKELTGGSKINARMNYSNNTNTYLKATHIMECNEKPLISGKIDDAVIRRLVDIPFRSTFTKKMHLYEGIEYVYEANEMYKQQDFKDKYKFAFFNILLKYWKLYHSSNMNYDKFIPESVEERTMEYLQCSDEIYQWFLSNYEKKESEILKLKDVHNNFKQCEIWFNMSKKERRDLNYKKFIEKIRSNFHFKTMYRDRYRPYMDDIQKEHRNIIIGYSLKQE
jgi:P4 family phage/plasmid primase-like protien